MPKNKISTPNSQSTFENQTANYIAVTGVVTEKSVVPSIKYGFFSNNATHLGSNEHRNLPNDIINYILRFLQAKDLAVLKAVSRDLRKYIHTYANTTPQLRRFVGEYYRLAEKNNNRLNISVAQLEQDVSNYNLVLLNILQNFFLNLFDPRLSRLFLVGVLGALFLGMFNNFSKPLMEDYPIAVCFLAPCILAPLAICLQNLFLDIKQSTPDWNTLTQSLLTHNNVRKEHKSEVQRINSMMSSFGIPKSKVKEYLAESMNVPR